MNQRMLSPWYVLILLIVINLPFVSKAQWVERLSGVSALSFVEGGSTIFVTTSLGGVLSSADGGANWVDADSGIPSGSFVRCFAKHGLTLFAGTNNSGIFVSNNNGVSWTAANAGLPADLGVYSIAAKDTVILAGTDDGVFLSANNGTSWMAVNSGLPPGSSINEVNVRDSTLLAAPFGSGVFLSQDNGASWTAMNSGLPSNTNVSSIAINGTDIFLGTYTDGVFLYTDNTASWTPINTGLTNTSVYDVAVSDTIIFAGSDGGVFLSTNKGTSWKGVNEGLPGTPAGRCLAVIGTNVFAGISFDGVWSRPLEDFFLSITPPNVTSLEEMPQKISANAIIVYPDKADHYITISGLNNEVFECVVIDITGRTATVKLEWQHGSHRADLREFTRGIYFGRVMSGNSVRKFKFIKQ